MSLAHPDQLFCGFRVATMASSGTVLARYEDGKTAFVQPDGSPLQALQVVVGVCGGKIEWIGPESILPAEGFADVAVIEGDGRWLLPGLIDCHTHLVYGGNRACEWQERLGGVPYAEIARRGGGILSTVRQTRMASEDQLVADAGQRLQRLLAEGVTTVEIKSGYGLDRETELKMLRAARQLQSRFPVRVVATLLAAHAVPPEFAGRADDYVAMVCNEIIPAARDLCSAVDAFCESIAFDCDQTERVFRSAMENGLQFKVHAEQLSNMGMAARAARMGALSADHLEYLTPEDCAVLGRHGTVATLLPGAFYTLGEKQLPPVQALRENAVPIAVSTDSNPGSSPLVSLLLAGNMACNLFGLTVEETILGMTRNAARALGLQNEAGALQPGFQADFSAWEVGSLAEMLYSPGQNQCRASWIAGVARSVH